MIDQSDILELGIEEESVDCLHFGVVRVLLNGGDIRIHPARGKAGRRCWNRWQGPVAFRRPGNFVARLVEVGERIGIC
jgi:hypothetical protein